MRLSGVVDQQTVSQSIRCDGLHVFRADEVASVQPGERARAALHRDRGPRARAPTQPLTQLGAVRLRSPCGIHQRRDVLGHRIGESEPQHFAARGEHGFLGHAPLRRRQLALCGGLVSGQGHYLERGRPIRIVDTGVQHEAIELGLGQGIGALLLDGVLGGHDQKQRRQRIGGRPDADLALGHGLEQRRLHLRGRAIDLVGEDQVMEQGPALEAEGAFLGPIDVRAREVAGKQVGRELHSLEIGLERVCQRLDGSRLGKARWPLDQQMAVGQKRDQQTLDQRFLSENLAAQVIAEPGEGGVRGAALRGGTRGSGLGERADAGHRRSSPKLSQEPD